MQQRKVTLLLSGVNHFMQSLDDWPPMPALQTLLSKGEWRAMRDDVATRLFQLFNIPLGSDSDIPAGAVSALGDGLDAYSGWWLRADPVHMVADRDQLYLSAADSLGLTQAESQVLVDELNQLYADDGWQFAAVMPQRWYLRLPQPFAMHTTPTAEVMGSRVGEVLPRGEDALAWQRVMTEIQMQFHMSPINRQRSENGFLEINSLWFWGGGELPGAASQTGVDCVVSADPLALGLARLGGIEVYAADPLSHIKAGRASHVLWQLTDFSPEHDDGNVFAPLLAMLRAGELSELAIEIPGLGSWRLERKSLKRWWRFRKPLSVLMRGNR